MIILSKMASLIFKNNKKDKINSNNDIIFPEHLINTEAGWDWIVSEYGLKWLVGPKGIGKTAEGILAKWNFDNYTQGICL